MAVKADLGLRIQCGAQCGDPGADILGQQIAGRVGDVDTVGAVALHQQALGGETFRLFMCAIIRKPTVSMPR